MREPTSPPCASAVLALTDSVRPADGSAAVPGTGTAAGSHEVEVAVVYDGPDLEEVARLTGLTPDEVVAAHTGTPWRVAFGGFAPGFAYLVGGDPRLAVPRRDTSRPRVPAGSVGLAGEYSGVYPRSSPGGWQLLGTTDAVLWDVDRDPPGPPGPREHRALRRRRGLAVSRSLEVLATGPLVLVEDEGRPGHGAVGVPHSGAADRGAHRLGARLVGHDPALASLEVLLGGLAVRARGRLTVALTGAPAPATLDDRPVAHASVVDVPDGAVLRLGTPPTGLRTVLTVRGGIDVAPVLGSRSTDTLSGLGPPPVAAGDVLPVGTPGRTFPTVDHAVHRTPAPTGPTVLEVLPGPRASWVGDDERLGGLLGTTWAVGGDSDRIGLRLTGSRVDRSPAYLDRELPSEGLVRGAVQVPPGGEPVVFLADHPVTGGYPVVAVLTPASADRAAQLRPGDPVRLTRRLPPTRR